MSSKSKKGFYITTAIAYPNSKMHVGFGWEAIGADFLARFERMQGRDVFFCTGVDEHSQNVEKAAKTAGLDVKTYCDQMADSVRATMACMDVAYDRFIRTSDVDHERVCQKLITAAHTSGDVYKQKYSGLYCESCEVFYTEKETIVENGKTVCPTHKLELKSVTEENYFFKLSKFEEKLKKLFSENPKFLEPESRRNEIVSFLEQGLKDFSVSRTSFQWGIRLPFDPDHIIYVWYDALINYLSAVGFLEDPALFEKFWPADVHVIGKDITRFHTIYWPAMLWSAGIELPKKVWAHGFIQLNGEKMSKTRGNIVTPDEVVADFGVHALRWYLLSANSFAQDGNYNDQDLILKCNADLSNNMGNLLNRSISMALKYFPEMQSDFRLKKSEPLSVTGVAQRMEQILGVERSKLIEKARSFDLSGYCQLVLEFSVSLNKFIDETKPWALAKDPVQKPVLETVLYELLEGIRNLAILLWPVIPSASMAILEQLGRPVEIRKASLPQTREELEFPLWSSGGFSHQTRFVLSTPRPLFPRIERATKV